MRDQRHAPDDHRARRQVGHDRHREAERIAREAERVTERELPWRRVSIGRDRRHDQRRKDEVDADELHRHRHHHGEEHVEADASEPLAPAEPDHEEAAAVSMAARTSCSVATQRIWPASRSLRYSPPCGLLASSRICAVEASTNRMPISASCTSGRLRSVQVSSSAPSSAATTAASCVVHPASSWPNACARDDAERRRPVRSRDR